MKRMKSVIVGLLVVFSLSATASHAQMAMPCGSGVILRAEGSIIIDAYTIYPMPSNVPLPIGAPPASAPPRYEPKQGPLGVTLGKSLSDDTPICIETLTGSRCVALKVVRTLR